MAFKYQYKTDEELELQFKQLASGECKFMIRKITDKDECGFELQTNAGYSKIDLELIVIDSNNEKGLVRDILAGNAAWKIKELCDAVGLPQFYNAKASFEPEAFLGLQGKATLVDREFIKKDGTKGICSSIKNYIKGPLLTGDKLTELASKFMEAPVASEPVPFIDDDLNF